MQLILKEYTHQVEKIVNKSENFELPFEGKLSENNRWVVMAELIPWSEFEQEYASLFSEEMGAPAKSFRMALGSLIIKEKLGTSDIETVEPIRENLYLQYFIGLSSYSNEAVFDPSMLCHFRQRIDINLVNQINQSMVKRNQEQTSKPPEKKNEASEVELTNRGKLINANRIEDRIVSINQPHIRPIVRGKAGSSVEFGAKIAASYI